MHLRPILIYAVAGFILLNFKSIAIPVSWFEVYFHELSHGLAALLTGGRIVSLELNFDGSGSLVHANSSLRLIVSFAGYAGATLWGLLVYRLYSTTNKIMRIWTLALIAIIAISSLLWVRDLETTGVILVLIALLLLLWRFAGQRVGAHIMRVMGAALMASSSQSAWLLIGTSSRGDADTLASTSVVIPSFIWITLWVLLGCLCLLLAYRMEARQGLVFKL